MFPYQAGLFELPGHYGATSTHNFLGLPEGLLENVWQSSQLFSTKQAPYAMSAGNCHGLATTLNKNSFSDVASLDIDSGCFCGIQFLRHAGRELDGEIFHRQFAGDQPGQKFVTGFRVALQNIKTVQVLELLHQRPRNLIFGDEVRHELFINLSLLDDLSSVNGQGHHSTQTLSMALSWDHQKSY
jgi:hypothetical protein